MRERPLPKRSSAQLVYVVLAALALCAWHDGGAARTKLPKRDSQRPPTILCLRAADVRLTTERGSDRKILDCLLQTANGAEDDQWQPELRRCLSASGVIRISECQY
jgi:hypothetical protein